MCPAQHTFRPRDTPHDRGGGGANTKKLYLRELKLLFGGVGGWSFYLEGLELSVLFGGFNLPGGVGRITGGLDK